MKAPYSLTMPMVQADYDRLHEALAHENASATFTKDGGTLLGHDVDFNWTYASGTLQIVITAVHSFQAKLASAAMVEAKMQATILAFLKR